MRRVISGTTVFTVLVAALASVACCPIAQNQATNKGTAPEPTTPEPSAPSTTNAPATSQGEPMTSEQPSTPSAASFADDLDFLKRHGEVITLDTPSGGVVAVSPKYQGRVMTSAVNASGQSLGYINRDFIASGKTGTQFDNYGGEDRFWLGPEGGQFALYFPPGKPFEFEHWQTPAAFQEGQWEVSHQSADRVEFSRTMTVTNYSGTSYEMAVQRIVRPLDAAAVARLLGDSPPSLDGLSWVGFETANIVKNVGKVAWTQQTGAPSIWILAMYNPSPDTWVIIPYDSREVARSSTIATSAKCPPNA